MRRLFRITARRYRPDDPSGAMMQPGRWHFVGQPVLYLSSSLALAVLEMKANGVSFASLREHYHYTAVDLGAGRGRLEALANESYDADWVIHPETTRRRGGEWIAQKRSLALEVRSAAIPLESNFLINPRHPGFGKLSFAEARPLPLDVRL